MLTHKTLKKTQKEVKDCECHIQFKLRESYSIPLLEV